MSDNAEELDPALLALGDADSDDVELDEDLEEEEFEDEAEDEDESDDYSTLEVFHQRVAIDVSEEPNNVMVSIVISR